MLLHQETIINKLLMINIMHSQGNSLQDSSKIMAEEALPSQDLALTQDILWATGRTK